MWQTVACFVCFGAGFICCGGVVFLLLSKGTSDIEKNGL